jgi:hypothetical protein
MGVYLTVEAGSSASLMVSSWKWLIPLSQVTPSRLFLLPDRLAAGTESERHGAHLGWPILDQQFFYCLDNNHLTSQVLMLYIHVLSSKYF